VKRLVLESYLFLLRCEFVVTTLGLRSLHRDVLEAKVEASRSAQLVSAEDISHAMDLACVFYPKRVFCLQRSAATALLLRRHGIRAELILGARILPFKSHAWVEVEGLVVNDRPYMREVYQILETCSGPEVSG